MICRSNSLVSQLHTPNRWNLRLAKRSNAACWLILNPSAILVCAVAHSLTINTRDLRHIIAQRPELHLAPWLAIIGIGWCPLRPSSKEELNLRSIITDKVSSTARAIN